MSWRPVRLVIRVARPRARSRWFVGSLVVHVALAGVIVLWPSRPRAVRGPIGPSIAVDLVGGVGGRATEPAARAEEPRPEPPRPRPTEPKPTPKPKTDEASLETRKVEVTDKPKPAEPEDTPERVEPLPPTTDEVAPADTEGPDGSGAQAPAAEGGEGDGGVAGAVGGGTVLGSEYAWYGARVTAALRANWRRPPLGNVREPLTAVVTFDIRRDGSIRNPRVVESSGVRSLDRSALRAVADAAPLPALPRAMNADSVPARFEFTWYPGDS